MTDALFEVPAAAETWHTGRLVGFDLETTSRFPDQARIVSAALVVIDPQDSSSPRFRDWLVDPGVEIPAETTAIHGISTEQVRAEGQDAAVAVGQIAVELGKEFDAGSTVVVMNAPYDFTVLAHEAARHGVGVPAARPVVDPLVIDKQVDKYRRGKRTLEALCETYQVQLDAAHTAGADAYAAVQVATALAVKYPQLQVPAEQIHDLQVGWKAEQAADFQAYLRRKNPAAVIDPTWPVAAAS